MGYAAYRPARDMRDQAREAEHEQPQAGHGERWQREPGNEREHLVVSAERPAPEQIVTDGEPGHEDQGPVRHVQDSKGGGGRTTLGRARRGTGGTYDRWR